MLTQTCRTEIQAVCAENASCHAQLKPQERDKKGSGRPQIYKEGEEYVTLLDTEERREEQADPEEPHTVQISVNPFMAQLPQSLT